MLNQDIDKNTFRDSTNFKDLIKSPTQSNRVARYLVQDAHKLSRKKWLLSTSILLMKKYGVIFNRSIEGSIEDSYKESITVGENKTTYIRNFNSASDGFGFRTARGGRPSTKYQTKFFRLLAQTKHSFEKKGVIYKSGHLDEKMMLLNESLSINTPAAMHWDYGRWVDNSKSKPSFMRIIQISKEVTLLFTSVLSYDSHFNESKLSRKNEITLLTDNKNGTVKSKKISLKSLEDAPGREHVIEMFGVKFDPKLLMSQFFTHSDTDIHLVPLALNEII